MKTVNDALRRLPWPSAQARDWAIRFIARACVDDDTEALLLIGSIARPVNHPTDVDMLYVYRSTQLDISDHPLDVDIRAYASSEVEERATRVHDVISWAAHYGLILCTGSSFWHTIAQKVRLNGALPDPAIADERARRAERVYHELIAIGDREAALEQRISWLTHLAWASLLRARIHPASRPELVQQLQSAGNHELANQLAIALQERTDELAKVAI